MVETEKFRLIPLWNHKHAEVLLVEKKREVLIVRATSTYIPKEDFENTFERVGHVVMAKEIKKVIFDKTTLTVFHQPSMVWYFTAWKENMYDKGLRIHRKILPNDFVFTESARIARKKMAEDFPDAKFHMMDIRYCAHIDEAIEN